MELTPIRRFKFQKKARAVCVLLSGVVLYDPEIFLRV